MCNELVYTKYYAKETSTGKKAVGGSVALISGTLTRDDLKSLNISCEIFWTRPLLKMCWQSSALGQHKKVKLQRDVAYSTLWVISGGGGVVQWTSRFDDTLLLPSGGHSKLTYLSSQLITDTHFTGDCVAVGSQQSAVQRRSYANIRWSRWLIPLWTLCMPTKTRY